jgi:hypothetical protein
VQCEPRLGGGCNNNNDFNELSLQRDTLNEGRCKVSGRKKEKTVQCEPQLGGDCLDDFNNFNESKYLPCNTLNEGRGKVSGKRKSDKLYFSAV